MRILRRGIAPLLALVLSASSPLSIGAQPATKKGAAAQPSFADLESALSTGRYDEVIESGKRLASDKSARAQVAPLRAEALLRTGRIDDAITILREVENEPEARRARLYLGEYLILRGKRSEARPVLLTLVEDYNADRIKSNDAEGLSMVGRAAHLLRSARDANEAYNDAEKAGAKNRVETLLWRSELFLDKYDPGHAGQVVTEAEKIAPQDPRVRVALARVKLENAMDFGAAEIEIKQALTTNPKLAEAHFVRAGLALRDLDIAAADAAVAEGLKTNPIDLELLAMKAAIRFLADDKKGFEAVRDQVFAQNPEYSTFFQIVSEYAEWEHRYDDIVAFMREAIRIDPADAKAHAQLGLNLIRAGKDDEGLEALRKAWDKDRFNVRVFNTLNLFEKSIASEYVTVTGATFTIRYAKNERAILERYVPRMLEEAWGSMVKRYRFTPKTPVGIELYADGEHFSVRTSGLPNVGIQGVCFGQTLALLSPEAAPFNWGNVLWHELGHVFAIQMSKNHVPRWFTEGLSEYETIIRRPEWQREEDPALFSALKAGKVPHVGSFNRAFTHVDRVEDVTMAYYAASQIIVFMAERFGFDKVAAMLPRWGKGERTPEIIQAELGISTEELDAQYRAWLKKKFARYATQYLPNLDAPPLDEARAAQKAAPNDARKLVELGIAFLRERQLPEGKAALRSALGVNPKEPDAQFILGDLALDEDKHDEAKLAFEGMTKNGSDGFQVRMKLAAIAEHAKDSTGARAQLWKASELDPSQSEPVGALVELAQKTKDGAAEIEALRRLTALEQHDRDGWLRLLEGLIQRGLWSEAVKVGESTIYVDPANPEVHRLYARALARKGRFVSAVYEYNSALIAGAPPESAKEIYRELAKAYDKLGQPKYAELARSFEKQSAAAAPKKRAPR